jgi:hypothetical protein
MHLASLPKSPISIGPVMARCLFLAACLGMTAAGGSQAWAEQGVQSAGALPFDIAAQPLTSALDAYGAATGIQVVYDGSLAAGRQSKLVEGSMTPDAALRTLLDGTGLAALYASATTMSLRPAAPAPRHDTQAFAGFMPYLAVVQNSVEKAFCRSPLTVPGAYQVKLEFRIGAAGEVLQPRLIGSTDNAARDQAIAGLLRGLVVDRPPPADMPQPVIMAIAPRLPAETGDCSDMGNAGSVSPGAPAP